MSTDRDLAMVLPVPDGDVCVPCWTARQGEFLALAVSMRPSWKAVSLDTQCPTCGRAVGRSAAQEAALNLAYELLKRLAAKKKLIDSLAAEVPDE